MKTLTRILASTAVLVVLAGCSRGDISMLNRAEPVGSPFNTYLANEYRLLANRLSKDVPGKFRGSDADHFAKKGLAAVDGMIVAPEVVEDWDVKGSDIGELAEARGELMAALENGGRDISPDKAAIAQSHFDCWILDEEQAPDETGSCRDTFLATLKGLQADVAAHTAAPPAPPAPAADSAPSELFPSPVTDAGAGAAVPLQQASYLVFFDWNKHTLGSSAKGVLDNVATELKERHDVNKIIVTGHTDTSGKEAYNQKLSLQRADAVRAALAARGLPEMKITADGKGENDLLVKTPDNTREPQNRRAAITLE